MPSIGASPSVQVWLWPTRLTPPCGRRARTRERPLVLDCLPCSVSATMYRPRCPTAIRHRAAVAVLDLAPTCSVGCRGWAATARIWRRSTRPLTALAEAAAAELLPRLAPGSLVVELGWRRHDGAAAERGRHAVHGIDASAAMVALARRGKGRATIVRGSVAEAELPAPCDAVVAVGEVLGYDGDIDDAFTRAATALRWRLACSATWPGRGGSRRGQPELVRGRRLERHSSMRRAGPRARRARSSTFDDSATATSAAPRSGTGCGCMLPRRGARARGRLRGPHAPGGRGSALPRGLTAYLARGDERPEGAVARELNRALLRARGCWSASTPALELLERLVGMQAQVPLEPVRRALVAAGGLRSRGAQRARRGAPPVRALLMRATIHLVSARDASRCSRCAAGAARAFRGPFGRRSPAPTSARSPRPVASCSCTSAHAGERPGALAALARTRPGGARAGGPFSPLVQVTPRGLWGRTGVARW